MYPHVEQLWKILQIYTHLSSEDKLQGKDEALLPPWIRLEKPANLTGQSLTLPSLSICLINCPETKVSLLLPNSFGVNILL